MAVPDGAQKVCFVYGRGWSGVIPTNGENKEGKVRELEVEKSGLGFCEPFWLGDPFGKGPKEGASRTQLWTSSLNSASLACFGLMCGSDS